MTLSLKGIAVSRGVALGDAYKIERGQPEVAEACIPEEQLDAEIDRFNHALNTARNQLKQIRKKIPSTTPTDIAAFIDTHLLMLNDPALSEVPIHIIQSQLCSAEWALKLQLDTLVAVFDEMDDPYLKTRRDDVVHVVNRILRILSDEDMHEHEQKHSLKGKIVIADDLTPADIVLLQHQGMIAFVTESGGPLSHTAILARSLKLPAIVGVHHAKQYLQNSDKLIVDGTQGIVLADASEVIKSHYLEKQQNYQRYHQSLEKLKSKPSITLDKYDIRLFANAELPEDLAVAMDNNVHGIGLYRTEFLYMNRNLLPDEEEQYLAYRQVAEAMPGKPVTIRTLDLGSDKQLHSMQYGDCPTNPALGLRAIRLCLNDPELFRPQLRAILRASANGNIRVMIPMLSQVQEITQVRELVHNIQQELKREKISFDPHIKIGGMIEVPAAAISAYRFARHLDFMSIGTNDLIQYTLAIDRIDEEVNYLYDPCHPSVLRLIHQVLKAGQRANIPVAMCGEMAGDPEFTRLLLGLGLREFSMQANTVLEVKNIVNHSSISKLVRDSRRVLMCDHSNEAGTLIAKINQLSH